MEMGTSTVDGEKTYPWYHGSLRHAGRGDIKWGYRLGWIVGICWDMLGYVGIMHLKLGFRIFVSLQPPP